MSTLAHKAAHMSVVAERFLDESNWLRLIVDNAPIRSIEAELARARATYGRTQIARDQAKHTNDEVERSVIQALMDIALVRVMAAQLWPHASDHFVQSATRGLR
jgi:hypothetical protein